VREAEGGEDGGSVALTQALEECHALKREKEEGEKGLQEALLECRALREERRARAGPAAGPAGVFYTQGGRRGKKGAGAPAGSRRGPSLSVQDHKRTKRRQGPAGRERFG